MNHFEIRNAALGLIKSSANDIIDNINNEISTTVAQNAEYKITFDTSYILSDEPKIFVDKVLDYVITHFRNRGIRIRAKHRIYQITDLLFNSEVSIPVESNEATTNLSFILSIEWYINHEREYMKHYV